MPLCQSTRTGYQPDRKLTLKRFLSSRAPLEAWAAGQGLWHKRLRLSRRP
jgi:hypothetical protein